VGHNDSSGGPRLNPTGGARLDGKGLEEAVECYCSQNSHGTQHGTPDVLVSPSLYLYLSPVTVYVEI